MNGFIGIKEDLSQIVLSFQGKRIPEKMTFFKFVKVPFLAVEHGEIHDGFYRAFLSVRELVVEKIRDLLKLNETANIFVTGHGLGAVISTLCALDVKQTLSIKGERISIYTFGAPRIGDQNFSDYADASL